jgi:hypothetical protein
MTALEIKNLCSSLQLAASLLSALIFIGILAVFLNPGILRP